MFKSRCVGSVMFSIKQSALKKRIVPMPLFALNKEFRVSLGSNTLLIRITYLFCNWWNVKCDKHNTYYIIIIIYLVK